MVKVLVVKPKPGSVSQLFSKLTAINSKNGPFDLVLCLSDLFAGDDDDQQQQLLEGKVKVPCPTYCMTGASALPEEVKGKAARDGGEICENLHLLDDASVTTLSTLGGLRLACFGGNFDPERFQADDASPYLSSQAVKSFTTSNNAPVDILLTHALPQLITLHSTMPTTDPGAPAWGCAPITEVLKASRPRYHFAGAQAEFWEREPFVWEDGSRTTRFINLGEFGNKDKARWHYAFTISPLSPSDPAPAPPPNTTPSPYTLIAPRPSKRVAPDDGFDHSAPDFRFGNDAINGGSRRKKPGPPPAHYTCHNCREPGHWKEDCPQKGDRTSNIVCHTCKQTGHKSFDCPMTEQGGGRRKKARGGAGGGGAPREIGPENCWFCLANPQVTKHLIASIGNETYVTLPKGQLPDTESSWPVPGGGHVLIIPIAHYPSLLALPTDLALPVVSELETFKSALRSCYASFGAAMVTFEVAKVSGHGGRSGHAHVQVCPVPEALADRVEAAFRQEGERMGVAFEEGEEAVDGDGAETNYFRVSLPDGRTLVHRIGQDSKFNLQFGRVALAALMGTPDRADWRQCQRSEASEKEECAAFKKAFAKFEPTFA